MSHLNHKYQAFNQDHLGIYMQDTTANDVGILEFCAGDWQLPTICNGDLLGSAAAAWSKSLYLLYQVHSLFNCSERLNI